MSPTAGLQSDFMAHLHARKGFFLKGMFPSRERRFLKVNFMTIVSLFLVILAGGVVRSTGSGMGCPDWPKCFDQIIPPTDASQLPAGYQDKYVEKRVKKNERFAKTLDVLGYGDLAHRIRHDKSILTPEEFNASKTWTEYVNRLVGVVTGFLMIACVFCSFTYLKSRKRIFFWSLFNVFLVGFQGWLGSIVVSTNLLAWIVTLHMLIAIAILAIAIYTYYGAKVLRDQTSLGKTVHTGLSLVTVFSLILTIVQITLGTEVREQVDAIASAMNDLNRTEWVRQVGLDFVYHRDLAILVVIVNLLSFVLVRRQFQAKSVQREYIYYVLLLIGLQAVSGLALSYAGLPPFAQAAHILLATLLFGAQFYFLLLLNRQVKMTK